MARGVEFLVFVSHDSAYYPEAQLLARELGGRLVDRLSNSIEDLLLVAKYRVIEPVTIVVLQSGRLAARFPRLVSREQIMRDLVGIT